MAWKKELFISYQEKRISLAKRNRYIKYAILLFFAYQILTTFFIQSYRTVNRGMEISYPMFSQVFATPLLYGPTLWGGKRLHSLKKPKRGEVFIVETPESANLSTLKQLLAPFAHFAFLQSIRFNSDKEPLGIAKTTMKRVVGLPGDTIKMDDYVVYVKPQGALFFKSEFELAEKSYEIKRGSAPNYHFPSSLISSSFGEINLKNDQYFVIGDNRLLINDSRTFGAIGYKSFIAKVLVKYWSWGFF